MSRVNLVVLWHMHQPQYRDPATGRYVLPWTRLHALKDYWGMVRVLEEFPGVHATFNVVPSLARADWRNTPAEISTSRGSLWRSATADQLTREDKAEILVRAFQVNHEQSDGALAALRGIVRVVAVERADAQASCTFGERDWRDLQVLSQLAWMDEEYLAQRSGGSALSAKRERTSRRRTKQALQRQADRIARARAAGISRSAPARADRNFHHAVLSPDSAAAVRYRHRARGQSAARRCRSRLSPSGGRARATAARARISRATVRRASRGAVALGGIGF